MLAQSPLIENGDLQLDATGQLVGAPDIVTQCTVTVGAYNCMYDSRINSALIPYLTSIPIGGRNNQAIVNIVTAAFQVLLIQNLLANLGISTVAQTVSYVTIKISATDPQQNPVSLSWSNA